MYRLEPHNPDLTRIRSIRHFSHYDRDCDGAIEALAGGSHGIESLQLRRLAHWLLHRLRLWFSIIQWPRETDRLGAAVDKGFVLLILTVSSTVYRRDRSREVPN